MKKFLLVLVLTIISSGNQAYVINSTKSKPINTVIARQPKNELTSKVKVPLSFKNNKDLLDIILLLPDSAFSTWKWKLEDRIKWYNEIKQNNYYISKNPKHFNEKYFGPNKAGFSIVDGFWSINIYKTSENSYIVITNNIAGDGNSLHFYEVKSNTLKKYLYGKTISSGFIELLKKKNADKNCERKFEELNYPIFIYDFSADNKIEIQSAGYLIKEKYDTCLNGNALIFNFDPKTKKFLLEKNYWKPKQKS